MIFPSQAPEAGIREGNAASRYHRLARGDAQSKPYELKASSPSRATIVVCEGAQAAENASSYSINQVEKQSAR